MKRKPSMSHDEATIRELRDNRSSPPSISGRRWRMTTSQASS
jgi:hypothetical protein